MINGIDLLAVTKLDVLDALPELKICTAYEINGNVTSEFPAMAGDLANAKPLYESMPGWQCSTADVRCWNDLPENAKKYLNRLAELVNAKVAIVSVGPKRAQTFEV